MGLVTKIGNMPMCRCADVQMCKCANHHCPAKSIIQPLRGWGRLQKSVLQHFVLNKYKNNFVEVELFRAFQAICSYLPHNSNQQINKSTNQQLTCNRFQLTGVIDAEINENN
jgi:hypothetical protein